MFLRGNTIADASEILQSELKSGSRQDISVVDSWCSARRRRYPENAASKAALLGIDGADADRSGIRITRLGNGVVVSRGLNGPIARCNIVSEWLPGRNGETRIILGALRGNPPRAVTTYTQPGIFPPVPSSEITPVVIETSDAEYLPTSRMATSPAAHSAGFAMPQIRALTHSC